MRYGKMVRDNRNAGRISFLQFDNSNFVYKTASHAYLHKLQDIHFIIIIYIGIDNRYG